MTYVSIFILHPAVYSSIGIPTLKSQKHETNILSFFWMMVIIGFVCGNTKGSLKEHRLNPYCLRCYSNTAQNKSFRPKKMQSKAKTVSRHSQSKGASRGTDETSLSVQKVVGITPIGYFFCLN